MKETISARRVRELMGDLAPGPAWANLADALTLLIGDGRIPLGVRLPSERELTAARLAQAGPGARSPMSSRTRRADMVSFMVSTFP